MAEGQWVTVPANQTRSGRAERRWQQPSGELMEREPGPGFLGAQLAGINRALGNPFKMAPGPAYELSGPGLEARRALRAQRSALEGRVQNAPLSDDQLQALSEQQNAAIRGYGNRTGGDTAPVAAPGLTAPVAYGDPAARARGAEQRRMMQQYASKEYWDTEQGKAMLSLGQQMTAPKEAKLADYYGAQRAVGMGSMNEILSGLASVDDRYKEGGDLRKWAEANQGLALRVYQKRFPTGEPKLSGEPDVASAEESANWIHSRINSEIAQAKQKGLSDQQILAQMNVLGGKGEPAVANAYTPDDRVIGLNEQGQPTVGEGAYGFDPTLDQMQVAARPVPAEMNRAEAGSVVPVAAQKANELVERYKRGLTRGQLIAGN